MSFGVAGHGNQHRGLSLPLVGDISPPTLRLQWRQRTRSVTQPRSGAPRTGSDSLAGKASADRQATPSHPRRRAQPSGDEQVGRGAPQADRIRTPRRSVRDAQRTRPRSAAGSIAQDESVRRCFSPNLGARRTCDLRRRLAATYGAGAEAVTPAKTALERARDLAGPEGNVLVCGSLYLVGEILAQTVK